MWWSHRLIPGPYRHQTGADARYGVATHWSCMTDRFRDSLQFEENWLTGWLHWSQLGFGKGHWERNYYFLFELIETCITLTYKPHVTSLLVVRCYGIHSNTKWMQYTVAPNHQITCVCVCERVRILRNVGVCLLYWGILRIPGVSGFYIAWQ
jgi:hypothetical protein